jgi:hypothetical protein
MGDVKCIASPLTDGGGGIFDGTGDYLTIPDSADFAFGSSDYCIEFWINTTNHGASNGTLVYQGDASGTGSSIATCIQIINGWIFFYPDYSNTPQHPINSNGALNNGAWHHIACVKEGTVYSMYVDGVRVSTTTLTWSGIDSANPLTIGAMTSGTYNPYNGYMAELRVSVGTNRYTGSSITYPTRAFTTDSYTKLLIHFWGTASVDSSGPALYDEFPIIPSGVTVTPAGTWTKDSLGNNKSVMKFDGSTNYLSLTDVDSWSFGAGDFTFCGWVKLNSTDSTGPALFCQSNAGGYQPVFFGIETLKIYTQGSYNGTTWGISGNYGSTTLSSSTWYHVTLYRTGGYIKCLLNGVDDGISINVGSNTLFDSTGLAYIGYNRPAFTDLAPCNIKDLLIYKGRALTVPEIKLIMARTHPTTGTGMIPGPYDYWRLTA